MYIYIYIYIVTLGYIIIYNFHDCSISRLLKMRFTLLHRTIVNKDFVLLSSKF